MGSAGSDFNRAAPQNHGAVRRSSQYLARTPVSRRNQSDRPYSTGVLCIGRNAAPMALREENALQGIEPTSNNRGIAHENDSIEAPHGQLKQLIDTPPSLNELSE